MGNAQGRIYFATENAIRPEDIEEYVIKVSEGTVHEREVQRVRPKEGAGYVKGYRAVIYGGGRELWASCTSPGPARHADTDPEVAYTKMREAALKLGTVVDLHRWGADGNTFAETVPF